MEAVQDRPTFPRHGSDYDPLPRGKKDGRVLAHAVQTINATPEQIYQVYTRAELLPTWQEGVVSVTPTSGNTFHWIMQDPASGKQVEFDSEVVEAIPGQRHVSRISNGPFRGTTDTVTFETQPFGRGTVVTMVSEFHLPGGSLAQAFAAVFSRSPEQMVIENLRHLKSMIEAGSIPSVEGQPAGPRGVTGKWKQFVMGENLPTPPGTSDRARPQDLPPGKGYRKNGLLFGAVAATAAIVAWFTVRQLR